jgi:hypothetical protein
MHLARFLVLIILFWAGSLSVRALALDEQYRSRLAQRPDSDVLRSPGVPVLHLVSLEHRLAAADVTWLAIVQEIGRAEFVTDAGWDRVERWSEIATDLDRLYFTVYHSTGVTLSVWAKRLEASNRILTKGAAELPQRWELLLVLGYNAYFVAGDAALGSDFMRRASQIEDSPRFLAALAGRMRYHAGDEEGAIELLEELIPQMEGLAREDAESRLKLLLTERRLRRFDDACALFKINRGALPASGREVVDAGLIDEPPQDYFGGEISFDDRCIARTKMAKVREFEAKMRVGERRGGKR